ncbi:FecR family protein [Steroidobacter flavus]|uniref:FecR family protein n=1 Tax=Steroidobacter flavus TaxID=1842136 RepID=A0ABV8T2U6_9GAMM
MNLSTDSSSNTAEAVEDMAAAWFWKKDSGHWTEQDQAEFEVWLNGSTAHRIAYLRLRAGWKGAARLQALGAGIPRGAVPPPGRWGNDLFPGGKNAAKQNPASALPQDSEGRDASKFKPLRWAVAIMAILAVAVTFYAHNTHLLWANQYSTAVGELDTISLADGSRVTLNTDTRIDVDLSNKERRIDLRRGEAFFVVAKDATRPFVVYVDDKRVTAVGTQFSVRRDADDIQVVVTEGHVQLEQASAVITLSKLAGRPGRPATALAAGAIARTAKSDVLVQGGSAPEAEQLLSWRNGYLVFEATPLADAVAEFNRYSARKIVIDDPSLSALRISGNFRSSNADGFLWLLKSGFHVKIEEGDDRVHLNTR